MDEVGNRNLTFDRTWDVAASLARRGELALAGLGEKFSWKDFVADRQLPDTELSVLCLELEQGFRLWETYCAEAEEQLALLPDGQSMTLRYEDFLTDPAENLGLLSAFAGLSPGDGQLAAVVSSLDTSRRNAWEREEKLRAFHQTVSDAETMKRHGY